VFVAVLGDGLLPHCRPLLAAAQIDPPDLSGDRLRELGELEAPDPLVGQGVGKVI
jgi:hypothetical protein